MRIQDHPPLHLTYCLNIHPGERWAENFQAIREKAVSVRDRLRAGRHGDSPAAAGKPFGLGLRLGRRAAEELIAPRNMEEFQAFLQAQDLYVFTINGFPYGPFHGAPVKEEVYRPDWRTKERLDYTILLADILCRLLPPGVNGSISTVPGTYKAWARTPEDFGQMGANLCDAADHLDHLREQTGKTLVLALEPEPDCVLETTEETRRFFNDPLLTAGRAHLQRARSRSAGEGEDVIRRHLGVCLDLAHAAVEFEDPTESLRQYASAGIAVAKVQLSAALAAEPTPEAMERLQEFRDEVYLHQVKVRRADGSLLSHPDLPQAMADPQARGAGREWRVHFHVPLFCDRYGPLQSTASLLGDGFWQALRAGPCEHLEIETYTFGVLPVGLRSTDVVDNVVREYRWVLERLGIAQNLIPAR